MNFDAPQPDPSPPDVSLVDRHSRRRRASAWRWLWLTVAGTFWAIAIIGLCVALVDDRWGSFAQIFPVMILLGIALLGTFFRAFPGSGAAGVLFYVTDAVRLNLPLPPYLEAAAQSERGMLARRILALRNRLLRGEPLASALGAVEPDISGTMLAKIDCAERCGQLSMTLQRLAERTRAEQQSFDAIGDTYKRWYPLVVIAAVIGGTGFVMVFVIPKFEYIFRDFGVPLPLATRAIMSIYRDWGSTISAACAAILMLLIAKVALDAFLRRRSGAAQLSRLAQRASWWTPPIASVVRARALADALIAIADTVAAGGSFIDAVQQASRLPSNPVLQQRLAAWSNGLLAGAPIQQAAMRARLPRAVWAMMGLSTSSANMEMSLRFLVRKYECDANRATALLNAATIPAITLVLGAVVCFVVLALFTPLIDLMNHLSKAMS